MAILSWKPVPNNTIPSHPGLTQTWQQVAYTVESPTCPHCTGLLQPIIGKWYPLLATFGGEKLTTFPLHLPSFPLCILESWNNPAYFFGFSHVKSHLQLLKSRFTGPLYCWSPSGNQTWPWKNAHVTARIFGFHSRHLHLTSQIFSASHFGWSVGSPSSVGWSRAFNSHQHPHVFRVKCLFITRKSYKIHH